MEKGRKIYIERDIDERERDERERVRRRCRDKERNLYF